MKRKLLISLIVLFSLSSLSYSQQTITGTITDIENGSGIPGVTILVKGTTVGTISDLDGKYTITAPAGSEYLVFSYIGMRTEEVLIEGNVVNLAMEHESEEIAEILVVASFATDRHTPVSFSNIEANIIEEKLGTQEYPEILKSTPSVYATKMGGGYGDGRINMRGFDGNNIGVLINGVPVNDMEWGKVYWSNWAGLSDVTRTMQVQRGLGYSKLALSSVGGTINIITKATDAKKGGSVFYGIGNDNYSKKSFTFSTGLSEKGWAITASGSQTSGDGYAMGTNFNGFAYFLSISKRLSDNQSISLTGFGAPQWHNQRGTHLIQEYRNSPYGRKYNANTGYINGEVYNGAYAYNNYHKPQISLNHSWDINSSTHLSTALYTSIGRGYGRRMVGNNSSALTVGYPDGKRDESMVYLTGDDYLDFERVIAENDTATNGTQLAMSLGYNSHDWYGIVSSLNTKLGGINITAGVDARYYKGYHYYEVDNLLGGDYLLYNDYNPNRDVTTPLYVGDRYSRDYFGEVMWGGLFLQGEYVGESFSAFLSASATESTYRRTDLVNYHNDDTMQEIIDIENIRETSADSIYLQTWNEYIQAAENTLGVDELTDAQKKALYLANRSEFDLDHTYQVTDWQYFLGYSVKGGINYNINRYHNVFANTGYFSKAPFFTYVFISDNELNPDPKFENVFSAELGYGLKTNKLKIDLTFYRTLWMNKSYSARVNTENTVNMVGLDALHQGVEFELFYNPTKKLDIKAMVSVGDWKWNNDAYANEIDPTGELVATTYIYSKGIHVGDAAQTTAAVGFDAEVLPKFKVGMDYNYYDRLYANFGIEGRTQEEEAGVDSWLMPSYHLLDFNMNYKFKIGNLNTTLYGKINNILDTEYFSESVDGSDHSASSAAVYYGYGRTWSLGLKFKF